MPITVGSRLHAWRRAASRFTEYGLVVAAEAPFGKFMVAPVAKFMGEVKEGTEIKHKVQNLSASILRYVETIVDEYGEDNEDGRLIGVVESLLGICDDLGHLLKKGQLQRWAKLSEYKKLYEEAVLHNRLLQEQGKELNSNLKEIYKHVTKYRASVRRSDARFKAQIKAQMQAQNRFNKILLKQQKSMLELLEAQGRQNKDLRDEMALLRHNSEQRDMLFLIMVAMLIGAMRSGSLNGSPVDNGGLDAQDMHPPA